jgi:transposase
MRRAPRIRLSDEEQGVLERWAQTRNVAARLALRAKVVLWAAEDKNDKDVATTLETRLRTISLWPRRFADKRLAGIERDARWGGRPAILRNEVARPVVEKATGGTPPDNAPHWTMPAIAQEPKVSRSTVRRARKANGGPENGGRAP